MAKSVISGLHPVPIPAISNPADAALAAAEGADDEEARRGVLEALKSSLQAVLREAQDNELKTETTVSSIEAER